MLCFSIPPQSFLAATPPLFPPLSIGMWDSGSTGREEVNLESMKQRARMDDTGLPANLPHLGPRSRRKEAIFSRFLYVCWQDCKRSRCFQWPGLEREPRVTAWGSHFNGGQQLSSPPLRNVGCQLAGGKHPNLSPELTDFVLF